MKKTPLPLFFFVMFLSLLFTGCTPKPSEPVETESIQEITTSTGIKMVLIPAGEFLMGDDGGEEDDEQPAHPVKVHSFYMDKYEVIQKSYEELMGKNTAKFKDPDKPIEQLGWFAAVRYCNMRSLREGLEPCYEMEPLRCNFDATGYRLPTEAEWEYACRAGSDTLYSFGSDPAKLSRHAWFKDNANNGTQRVGQKIPNAWGLFDMHGNVWEWCNDFYSNDYYSKGESDNPRGPASGEECVLRGGGWNSSDEYCRSSTRYSEPPGLADTCFGYEAYGFRCVKKADVQ